MFKTKTGEIKKILGITGPSVFSPEIQSMVEKRFNAIPIYINQNDPVDLEFVFGQLDGIILAGGRDICPISYDKDITNHQGLSTFDIRRDKRERLLVDMAFANDKPILGICRGHQFLGVYHCPKVLVTDISGSNICHQPSASKIDTEGLPCHRVYLVDGVEEESFHKFVHNTYVNSYHHQAIWFKDSPKLIDSYKSHGIEPIGYSITNFKDSNNPEEVILEFMRGNKNRWISCQWHPETDYDENKASEAVLAEFEKMLG